MSDPHDPDRPTFDLYKDEPAHEPVKDADEVPKWAGIVAAILIVLILAAILWATVEAALWLRSLR